MDVLQVVREVKLVKNVLPLDKTEPFQDPLLKAEAIHIMVVLIIMSRKVLLEV